MDAVIMAGGVPNEGEPLYEYTQGKPKALLDIAGKPMAQWVLDALGGADKLSNIVAIGLPEDAELHCDKPITYLPSQVGIIENARAGLLKVMEINPEAELILVSSSDIPSITSEMINWAITTAEETEHDIYYNVVQKEVMEGRFPGSNRSFVRLRDRAACGGDIHVVRASLVTEKDELWQRILDARKNAFKQAALLGFDTLLLLVLRMVSLEGAEKRVSKRLGLRGRAILCPYAEMAMDVDKPHQLEILRKELSKRVGS
jgi:molybdopterin-guanine dinucleotide biosynthesis protein A